MENFSQEFESWMKKALSVPIPNDVIAFAFNLYETGLTGPRGFAVELIGATDFDPDNEDWACDESFVAAPRRLDIPLGFAGDNWQSCLDNMCELVRAYMRKPGGGPRILSAAQGVAVGFVDGDLIIVNP